MTLAKLTAAMLGGGLQVGDPAPEFSALDTDGQTHSLAEMRQRGPVVLAFFPKAFTPGCTNEMKGYRDHVEEVTANGAQVLGISTDSTDTQKKFKAALQVPFALIADPEGELAKLYRVKTPVVAFAIRRTFVIGRDGRIRAIFDGGDAVDPRGAIGACQAPSRD